MRERAQRGAGVLLALVLASPLAAAQEPPPPPPNLPPQYVPPPTPQQGGSGPSQPPPARREPRREREREREPPPRRFVPPPPPPPPRDEAPAAARGFQMALRTGLSVPLGDVSGDKGEGMSHDFATQVPLMVELGAKVHPMIFLGAYAGLSLGGTSSAFADAQGCASGSSSGKSGRSCLASTLRIGFEVQIHFQPAERVSPWVGYGLGFESASASANGGGSPEASDRFTGFELARLAGGVDFRLSRLFGIGPFAELPFGTYSHAHVTSEGTTADASIANTALHVWPTIGVRGVFFP